MKINGASNIGQTLGNEVVNQVAQRATMNLFGGDTLNAGGGSGLFPRGQGGTGGIDELLAKLSKKDKNNSFDTGSVGENLFKGGMKAAGEGLSALSGAASGGMQQAMGAIMGLVKQLLPMVMGMLGGL